MTPVRSRVITQRAYSHHVVRALLVFAVVLAGSWVLLALLAARLPEGSLKQLASFLPDSITTMRRLRTDRRVPRRAKLAIGFAAIWVLSPIDPIPEFVPLIGVLDDVVIIALALRYAARQVPREVLFDAWPGRAAVIERLIGDRAS